MRGGKKNLPPAGGLISLSGSKAKRPSSESSRVFPSSKKSRGDTQNVAPAELVSRVETLLASGNLTEAEALLVSVLIQMRLNVTSAASLGAIGSLGLTRPTALSPLVTSRLAPAYSLGLLVLAKHQTAPSLFSRPEVMEKLYSLMSLTPRDYGGGPLPSSAVINFTARSRGLHALVANLLQVALSAQSKWPVKLLKLYLEDSLSDRVWVDLEECKAFVLNLETAFPPVTGDPRGLFSVLCGSSQMTPAVISVHTALGLIQQPTVVEMSLSSKSATTELTDAIAVALNTRHATVNTAKIIHSGDPTRLVSPRFETGSDALEVIILKTFHDALSRRSTGNLSLSLAPIESGSNSGSSGPPGDVVHTRSLIRTLAIAAGIAEVRSISAQRLEPWLTTTKLQNLAAALLSIICLNCKLGAASPFDVDVMITVTFRIRLKLLKTNIQASGYETNYSYYFGLASFLNSVCRLACANTGNLSTLLKLCLASELPTIAAFCESSETATQTARQQISILPPVASQSPAAASLSITNSKCLTGFIKVLCSQTAASEQSTASMSPSLLTARANLVAIGAGEALAKGHTSVPFILPRLFQRFPVQWSKVLSEVLHDRIIEAVTCPVANTACPGLFGPPLPPQPTDSQLVSSICLLLAPTRQLLRELSKWLKIASCGTDFLPCGELGFGLLMLDRSIYPAFHETAATVAQRLLQASGGVGRDGACGAFSPFTLMRYMYAVVHVLCQLQLLSATRPNLCDAPAVRKKATGTSDVLKQHQTCVRQLRLNFLRWFKSFVPHLISSAVPHFPVNTPLDAFANLSMLLRRCFFLEATTPIDIPLGGEGCRFSKFYAAEELWPADQDQKPFVCHLTYISLPEKVATHVMRYGLESQWRLVSPPDSAAIVCELIWRATALSIDSGSESSNFSKLEEMIDLLYACCAFCSDQDVPSDLTDLAYSESYWKVSLALVALAAHSPKICGSHLWIHYPTVRRLMEMVITNNFTYPPLHTLNDANAAESERLNRELETQKILRLEAVLACPPKQEGDDETTKVAEEDQPPTIISPADSQMIGKLVRNNPQGVSRCPPDDQIANLKRFCDHLGLRQRLCASRNPDLLLELISPLDNGLPHAWVIELVESTAQNIESLPLRCLSEYLLSSSITRMQSASEKAFSNGRLSPAMEAPLRMRQRSSSSTATIDRFQENTITVDRLGPTDVQLNVRRFHLDSSTSSALNAANAATIQLETNRRRLHHRILERLRSQARNLPSTFPSSSSSSSSLSDLPTVDVQQQPSATSQPQLQSQFQPPPEQQTQPQVVVNNIADAVMQSFASRLKDPSMLIRKSATYCLALLAADDVTSVNPAPLSLPEDSLSKSVDEILVIFQSLVSLPGLSDPTATATATPQRMLDLLNMLLGAILVEDDLPPIIAYIIFLGQLTQTSTFVAWRPALSCLSQLLLNRRTVVQRLFACKAPLNIHPPPLPPDADALTMPSEPTEQQLEAGYIVVENIARILALDVNYYCTSAGAIPVNEKNSVFVGWSADRECPMELETLESHLVLLSSIPRRYTLDNGRDNNTWWSRLLGIWFTPSEPPSNSFKMPAFASLNSAPIRTPKGMLSLSKENKLNFSSELRKYFILSGIPQLISAGLADIDSTDLEKIILTIPVLLLDPSTASQLYNCALPRLNADATLPQHIGTQFIKLRDRSKPKQDGRAATVVLTTSRIFLNPPCSATTHDSIHSSSISTPQKLSATSHFSPISPASQLASSAISSPGSRDLSSGTRNLWRGLLSRFVELDGAVGGGFFGLSNIFCCTMARLRSSPASRSKWIQDLVYELQASPTTPKRTKPSATTTTPLIDQFYGLPSQTSLSYALNIVRSCLLTGLLSNDSKVVGRCRTSIDLVFSKFKRDGPNQALVNRILLHPLRRMSSNHSTGSDADNIETTVSADESIDKTMEILSTFGVSSHLPMSVDSASIFHITASTTAVTDANPSTGQLWNFVYERILRETTEDMKTKKTQYLLEDLVHNSSLPVLRFLLQRLFEEEVTNVNSTFALDFIAGVLDLPVLTSPPITLAEAHLRPDCGTLLPHLHRLRDPVEAMRLIAHVHSEAVNTNSLRDQLIAHRVILIDLALKCQPVPTLQYIVFLSRFDGSAGTMLQLTPDLKRHFDLGDHSTSVVVARRLLLCLYLRRPGIEAQLRSRRAREFLCAPAGNPGDFIPECFTHTEISRLGPSLLISLSGSGDIVRATAAPSAFALAVHHPRACLRILPIIAGTTKGRLDTSLVLGAGNYTSASTGCLPWSKFVVRRHIDFFTGLLTFVELLAGKGKGVLFSFEAEQFSVSIDEILSSLVLVAASYPNHARKMASGLSGRLSRLLQTYGREAPWSHRSGLFGFPHSPEDGRHRTQAQMTRLASIFNEFSCLPALISNVEETDTGTVESNSVPLPVTPPKTAKHCNPTALNPFIQRLRSTNNVSELLSILAELDAFTERKVESLVYFQAEIEHLLVSSNTFSDFVETNGGSRQPTTPDVSTPAPTVHSLLLKLLFRLLRHAPQLAESSLASSYLPCLDDGVSCPATLSYLPEACLMAPRLAPRLLHNLVAASVFRSSSTSSRLGGGGGVTGSLVVDAVSAALQRISLDGVNWACKEHASSGVLSTATGPKYATM